MSRNRSQAFLPKGVTSTPERPVLAPRIAGTVNQATGVIAGSGKSEIIDMPVDEPGLDEMESLK